MKVITVNRITKEELDKLINLGFAVKIVSKPNPTKIYKINEQTSFKFNR